MLLEFSQYLENYLWVNYTPQVSSNAYLMSICCIVNEKFRENVPAWEVRALWALYKKNNIPILMLPWLNLNATFQPPFAIHVLKQHVVMSCLCEQTKMPWMYACYFTMHNTVESTVCCVFICLCLFLFVQVFKKEPRHFPFFVQCVMEASLAGKEKGLSLREQTVLLLFLDHCFNSLVCPHLLRVLQEIDCV